MLWNWQNLRRYSLQWLRVRTGQTRRGGAYGTRVPRSYLVAGTYPNNVDLYVHQGRIQVPNKNDVCTYIGLVPHRQRNEVGSDTC